MDPVSSIARSGLVAAQTTLAQSAHNTANATTAGFKPGRVNSQDVVRASRGAGVQATPEVASPSATSIQESSASPATGNADAPEGRAGVAVKAPFSEAAESALSGTDLISETTSQLGAGHAFTANVRTLQTNDALTESLLRIKA